MLRRNILLMSGIAAATSVSTLLAACGGGNSTTNLDARNGVAHVVDKVLLPPA